MTGDWLPRLLVVVIVAGTVPGCEHLPFGQKQAANTDLEDFDDLDENESDPDGLSEDDRDEAVAAGEFSLKLEKGRRFPLLKTVEQRITQSQPSGTTVGYSKLELMLSLVVEEARGDDRRLRVQYHRVRFAQDLGGQLVEYNSETPGTAIPTEALAYAGLKDNGFSFWLGSDNRVKDLVGFPEFLERCLQAVPAEQRMAVSKQLQAMRSEDGLANFVDDSIGLLPHPSGKEESARMMQVGSTWDVTQRGGASMPASTTRCKLTNLDAKSAEIALAGSIGPSSYLDELNRVRLQVRGGGCSGNCTVDRESGMPTKSRVERFLDMVCEMQDGSQINQRKEVVTTITAFLEQGAHPPVVDRASNDRGSRQATDESRPRRPRPL
ncbi:MAG: DUF6263 family protein [Planctomycetaceae bacterium]|nr:DUF6263 family protein [Planctomycetaceae bacterium]